MSDEGDTYEEIRTEAKQAPKKKGRITFYICVVLVLLLMGLNVASFVFYEQLAEAIPVYDEAARTIGLISNTFLAATLLLGWYVFLSGSAIPMRIAVGVLAFLTIAIPATIFVPDENTGNLLPSRWRLRWAPPHDARLGLPEAGGESEVAENGLVDSTNVEFDQDNLAMATLADEASDSEAWNLARISPNSTYFQDFPQYRGPYRTGYVPNPAIDPDWSANPPVEKWRVKIGAGWAGFVTAGDVAFTMEQRGDEELTTCYSVETGDVIWYHSNPGRLEAPLGGIGPRATPTLHQGRLYAMGGFGLLTCFDASDGTVIWERDVYEDVGTDAALEAANVTWGRAGSPLIHENKVIVPAGGKSANDAVALIAYSLEDGSEIWRAGKGQISYASPLIGELAGKRQVISLNENHVAGYDPDTGEELWRSVRPGESNAMANTAQPTVVGNDRLLLTKGYGLGAELLKLEQKDGSFEVTTVWSQPRVLKTKFTSAVAFKGFAYGLSDGILECVRIEDGKSQWRAGRYGHGQILMIGMHILVLGEDGELAIVAVSPEKYLEISRIQALDGVTWNTLCIAGNKLLIRNAAEAVCYELPIQRDSQSDSGAKSDSDSEASPSESSDGQDSAKETSPDDGP